MTARLNRFFCWIGWHSAEQINHDGFQYHAVCRDCAEILMRDSQGNWFTYRKAKP